MWPELKSTVLYPPPPQRDYRCDGYGDYIFMVSRLTPLKRADLLVGRWRRRTPRAIRAVHCRRRRGARRARSSSSRELGLADRVTFTGRLTDDAAASITWRGAAPSCFPPLDEDYGFVTVEAFASRKAVITCRDSGGPAELVEDGVNGFVCEPTPEALAPRSRA